jgi:hypothetical protein
MAATDKNDKETIRANWKVFVACGIMVVSPFQYGLDFGLIGGLQAMPGFLAVRSRRSLSVASSLWRIGF